MVFINFFYIKVQNESPYDFHPGQWARWLFLCGLDLTRWLARALLTYLININEPAWPWKSVKFFRSNRALQAMWRTFLTCKYLERGGCLFWNWRKLREKVQLTFWVSTIYCFDISTGVKLKYVNWLSFEKSSTKSWNYEFVNRFISNFL